MKQAERYRRVANDLKHESASWITAADLTTRINADLFADVPTTTGIVTKYSDQWRYQCQSSEYQLQQALYPKRFVTTKTPKELEEHMQAEQKFRHRQSVEEFLSGMVGSGEELLKLKDLVDDMVGDTIENKGGLLDEWKYCQQLVRLPFLLILAQSASFSFSDLLRAQMSRFFHHSTIRPTRWCWTS